MRFVKLVHETNVYLLFEIYWLFICGLQLSKSHVLAHKYIYDIYDFLIRQSVHLFFYYLAPHASTTNKGIHAILPATPLLDQMDGSVV